MRELDASPRRLDDLIQASCDDLLDDESFRELEQRLLADPEARRRFALAHRVQSEIRFVIRSRHASETLLGRILTADGASEQPPQPVRRRPFVRFSHSWSVAKWAAAALIVLAVGWGLLATARPRSGRPPIATATERANVAWLVNAQDCQWAQDESEMPGRDMSSGKLLRLRVGLAEIEFDQGARVLLEGPAVLELLTGNSARLLSGKMTAHVPSQATGFTMLSPTGKVIDLGTEFGLTVDDLGNTTVKVFSGEVQASPLTPHGAAAPVLTLFQDQVALIAARSVEIENPTAPGEGAVRDSSAPSTLPASSSPEVSISTSRSRARGLCATRSAWESGSRTDFRGRALRCPRSTPTSNWT